MKRVAFVSALALTALLLVRGRADEPVAETKQDLMSLEREWADAIVKHDVKILDRVLADDYILTTPIGQVVDKGQVLKSIRLSRDASFEVRDIASDEVATRVYGKTAIVTHRFTLKGRVEGREVATPYRHTDVFVQEKGRWRCVSRQATRIVEPPTPAS